MMVKICEIAQITRATPGSSLIIWYVWKCFPLYVTTQLQEPYLKTIASRVSRDAQSRCIIYAIFNSYTFFRENVATWRYWNKGTFCTAPASVFRKRGTLWSIPLISKAFQPPCQLEKWYETIYSYRQLHPICIPFQYLSDFLKIYMHNLRAFYVHFWFKIYFQCSKNEKKYLR